MISETIYAARITRPVFSLAGYRISESIKNWSKHTITKFKNFVSGYYDAGSRDKKTAHWQPRLISSDEEYIRDYDLIRARSRDLYRNNHNARAVINRYITSVVGRGLKLQPKIDFEILGISPDHARAWQREVAQKFNLWAIKKDSDLTNRKNFYSLQALAYKMMLRDGDAFALLHSRNQKTRIKLVGSQEVMTPHGSDQDKIIAGIELGNDSEALAYHIKDQDSYVRIKARGRFSGKPNIIHLYEPDDVNQTRGLPILYPVVILIRDIQSYFKAELQSTIVNSLFSVVLKDETDDGFQRFDNAPLDDQDVRNFKLGPGSVIRMPRGKSIETVNAARPVSNFGNYTDSLAGAIAMGVDMPYEVFSKKFMSSYSAARAALLDFRQNKEIKRTQFIEDFCQPIYEAWLYERVLLGEITADGFLFNSGVREAWSKANWIGDSDGQIDETKEITAIEKRLALSLTTHEKESVQLNGTSFRDNIETLLQEVEMLRDVKEKAGSLESSVNV